MAKRKRSKRANGEGTVYQLPNGRWRAEFTVRIDAEGKQKRKSVYADTKQEAVRRRDELKLQVATGFEGDEKICTVDYLRRWLREKKPSLKPKTYAGYEQVIEKYAKDTIGGVMLRKLRPLHIQTMMREIEEEVSADAANRTRKVVHAALNQAVKWQKIARNPAEAIDKLPHAKREMVLWSAEQAARFLDTAKGHRLYPAFYLLMSSGLRCGELLGLKWDDLEGNLLHVRRSLVHVKGKLVESPPKTDKGKRRVPLSPDVVAELEEHRRRQDAERAYLGESYSDGGFIFATALGTNIHPRNLLRAFYLLQERTVKEWMEEAERTGNKEVLRRATAGTLLPRVTLHDLRHLHASIAIRSGMDPKMLADRLGHAHASLTLDVYTHLFDEHREQSAVSIMNLMQVDGSRRDTIN